MPEEQEQQTNSEKRLACDVYAAAEMLSCSPGSVRKFLRQEKLPRISGLRKILIPIAALERFVNQ
jgi:hypothetical protein